MYKNVKKIKKIMVVLIVMIAILSFSLGVAIYNGKNIDELYHFEGNIEEENTSIKADVFVARNKKGDLLNYSTTINYSKELIVGAQLYHLNNSKKEVILGNDLDMYLYSKKNENKKEYGYDYLDNLTEKSDDLYLDLCKDSYCEEIFETIKLSYVKW